MSHDPNYVFVTKQLSTGYDYHAPDGSEIRLLPSVRGGSLAHCTLPPGKTTQAVRHRTVEELWYCLSGAGQIWRKLGDLELVVDLNPGTSITIPTGMCFQFRTIGSEPLCILITTMPPWPGKEEAVPTDGCWELEVAPP
jgi:mannose-6-phosphate isomerase-like protein (cupin superfamily)